MEEINCEKIKEKAYKEKLDKQTKHLNNIYMLGVNNYITDACIENIYKEDKNRHETIKWILNFGLHKYLAL